MKSENRRCCCICFRSTSDDFIQSAYRRDRIEEGAGTERSGLYPVRHSCQGWRSSKVHRRRTRQSAANSAHCARSRPVGKATRTHRVVGRCRQTAPLARSARCPASRSRSQSANRSSRLRGSRAVPGGFLVLPRFHARPSSVSRSMGQARKHRQAHALLHLQACCKLVKATTATNRAPRGNNHLGLKFFIFIKLRNFIKEFAAKEKLEIVIGAAPPHFGFFARGFPHPELVEGRKRFAPFQEYWTR